MTPIHSQSQMTKGENDRQIDYRKHNSIRPVMLIKRKTGRFYSFLAKYREAFSLRDEIGKCPSIEVDSQIIDNLHFIHFLYQRRR